MPEAEAFAAAFVFDVLLDFTVRLLERATFCGRSLLSGSTVVAFNVFLILFRSAGITSFPSGGAPAVSCSSADRGAAGVGKSFVSPVYICAASGLTGAGGAACTGPAAIFGVGSVLDGFVLDGFVLDGSVLDGAVAAAMGCSAAGLRAK